MTRFLLVCLDSTNIATPEQIGRSESRRDQYYISGCFTFACMNEFVFKNAALEDLPRIVEIYNSTVPGRMVTADTEPVSLESRLKWFYEHNAVSRPLWVMQRTADESIIGWVSFQSFYGRPAYNATVEVSIYLDEAVRGKGIGKMALNHALQQAEKFGVKTLLGFIFAHNEPSLRLFKSFGFGEWANMPNVAILDGVERGLIILGKRVG